MDPVNNASEFTSRINYVATSALSLGVALGIPGQNLLTGPLLYGYVYILSIFEKCPLTACSVYIITYALCFCAYFTFMPWHVIDQTIIDFFVINRSFMHKVVKSAYLGIASGIGMQF